MQEEVENRTISLIISGSKFTGRLLKAAVPALGAGLSIWGAVNLLEGYETDDPALKDYGLSLVMRGSVIAALGASGFGCPPELLSGDSPDIP